MRPASESPSTIVESSQGPFIAGTRITLYDVMDYLNDDWPADLIQHWLKLTNEQMTGAMAYIESHRSELEEEYQLVLNQSEEIRRYWEERNKEKLSEIAAKPPEPGREKVRTKLLAWKARLANNGESPGRP